MDHDRLLALFDRQMRRDAPADPGCRIERTGQVVRQTADGSGWTAVIWSQLDEAGADAAIAQQVAHFRADRREFEWKLYSHDRPADLGARLAAAGFTAGPAETLMAAPVAGPPDVGPPPGVVLEAVTDAAGVELFVQAQSRAFGRPDDRARTWLCELLETAPERTVLVVALAGGVPVSAARMDLHPGTEFASLWGGGTVPGWRGRGVYRALVAHRARIAAARGYRYLQVDASDLSRPVLERLGFAALSTTTPYTFPPGDRLGP